MDIHKTLLDLRPIMCYTTSALGAEGCVRGCMISRKQAQSLRMPAARSSQKGSIAAANGIFRSGVIGLKTMAPNC